jgi:nucleotide-binding universal stress UspA family protein
MKRIIVPIDFTEVSKAGIEHAIEVALKNDSSLILVHVLSYHSEKDAKIKFESFLSGYPLLKKIPYIIVIEEGERIQMLVNAVNAERADFMIIATKGAPNDLEEISIAYQMISRLNIPVLVIPHKVRYQELNKILFTTDYKELQDSNILKNLYQLAQSYDAKVHVLYVGEKAKIQKEERERLENTLEYFLETIDHYYDFSDQDDIEKGIVKFVKEKQIDLLAMVSRRHSDDPSVIKQSLVREIALHTKVPLLTLPEIVNH